MKKQKQNQDPIKFSEPQTDYSLENTPNTSQNFNKSIFNCKTIIKKKNSLLSPYWNIIKIKCDDSIKQT
jgi:hypothetical protein